MKEIDGHPLSIVLAATQAKHLPTIEMLYQTWTSIQLDLGDKGHESLLIALKITWNHIAIYEEGIILWGILALFHEDFPMAFSKYLPVESATLNHALFILHENSIIEYTSQNEYVNILMSIKEQWNLLDATNKYTKICYHKLFSMLDEVAQVITNPWTEPEMYELVSKLTSPILSLLQKYRVLSPNSDLILTSARFHNIYKFDITRSIPYLKNILSISNEGELTAYLSENIGKLYFLSGEYQQMSQYYNQAENMYIKCQNILGIVYIKKERGEMFHNQGRYECALELFKSAKQLIWDNPQRTEIDKVIMPHILKAEAHAYRELGTKEKCEKYYTLSEKRYIYAMKLYQLSNLKSGLAYTQKGLGDLYILQGKPEAAIIQYEDALSYFEKVKEPLGLGNTCAALLRIYFTQNADNQEKKKIKKCVEICTIKLILQK